MPHHAEASRSTRWVANRQAPLIWRSWDDNEHIVYSPASGDTHLINDVTAEVLRRLERAESEVHDLVLSVAESLGVEPDPRFEVYVMKLVDYLDRLGLIEPLP